MSTSITLWDLEQTLVGLMQILSDPEATDEERDVSFQELQRYVSAEITKVDNIRQYLKHCDLMAKAAAEEAKRQANHAATWKHRAERLEQLCIDVMQATGRKKLEGRTGSLSVRGNGGVQPLTIAQPSLVPDELCVWRGTIGSRAWGWLQAFLGADWPKWSERQDVQMERCPLNDLVRAKLKQEPVAGARLEERGVHLHVE